MELGGVLGLDSYMVGSSSSFETSEAAAAAMKQKGLFGGARFLKHGRSSSSFEPLHEDQQEDDEWNNNNSSSPNNNNNNKVAKTDHHQPGPAAPSPFLFRSNFDSHSLFPQGEQMLSFSSSTTTSRPNANANALMLSNISSNDGPSCHQYYSQINPISSSSAAAPPSFYRNATPGIISGSSNLNVNAYMNSMNYMNMNMQQQQQQQVGGVGGPFTPSQWMELEYQALIYKHIDANVPVPPSLLIPIRRSINQSPLSNYPPGSFRPAPLGWGSYHLGFSGNADPEPGRCRRTDGKKWRCSRDAVADQKYCERHMNRGRHRSRKLVEGRSGQASSSSSSKTMSMPLIASSSSQHSTTSAASIGLPILQQQPKSLLPNFMDPSPSQLNRILMSEESLNESIQNSQGLSLLTAGSTKPGNSLASILKHHNPFEAHSLNPPRSSYSENVSFDSSLQLEDRNSQTQNHHLRHFIDDWPKAQPDHQPIAWPELEDMKSDRTQLSISIPTDFSSSTSSPNQEKLALSPLRLSREFNPISEENRRQSSWIPISWEPTIGGPLGEALTNTNSSSKDLNFSKNCSSSSLNLLTDGWDSSSPILDSSPTGVLQKTTFGSLSSSTGSSPRADNLKVIDSTSNMCDNLLGSTL